MAELVFKNRVREYRQKQGLSQGALSQLVHTTRQTIIAIENGTFSPTAKLAYLLCLALDVKFEDLFYFE